MVDYTKIRLCNINIERLLNLPFLDFEGEYSRSTGYINQSKFVALYHHCEIMVFLTNDKKGNIIRSRIMFTGSIHKMWNSIHGVFSPNYNSTKRYKGYNGNEFSLKDIHFVREHLKEILDCTFDDMVFESIEFGINSMPTFSPTLFIKGLLCFHAVPFEFSHSGHNAQAALQRYIFKIYDKSYHYGIGFPVLRIELKFRKMIELQRFGIKSFADINSISLSQVAEFLNARFAEIIYFDYTIDEARLGKTELLDAEKYKNANFWNDLESNRRDRPKKHLESLIKQFSDNLKLQIRRLIVETCVRINHIDKEVPCVRINRSSIKLILTEPTSKFCAVTGLEISMQKEKSILLSHTGLKFYRDNQPQIFAGLVKRFLSSIWINTSPQQQIKELAHNIRNVRSNQQIRQRQLYPEHQQTIFDLSAVTNT